MGTTSGPASDQSGDEPEVSRTPAIVIVLLLGAVGIALFWWGISDVLAWSRNMANCAPTVAMDTSSFWFLGAVAAAVLPFLAVVKDKYHTAIFTLFVAIALALPVIGYLWVYFQAQNAGYDVSAMPSLFSRQAFSLTGCAG